MRQGYNEPVYVIGIAAKLLKVCPATLRIWEKKNLINPARIGKSRFYSKYDLEKLEYIKKLLQKKRINIEGVKNILNTARCWDIKKCKPKDKLSCPVYIRHKHQL